MNNKISKLIKNFSYSVSVNIVVMGTTLLLNLIAPKFLGVKDYSYWQLYIFYLSYVGFFHLGWADGIYLRYGGKRYSDLDKNNIRTQFWMLFIVQIIFGIILFFIICNNNDNNFLFIMVMTIIYGIIANPRYIILFVLQATNKIKEYSKIMLVDRFVFCGFMLIVFILKFESYKILIVLDILSRIISMIYAMLICKDIIFGKLIKVKEGIFQAYKNISIGSKLMFANIASNLIIGIVRIGVQIRWSIEVFGKLSFTISISNIILNFINSISLVIFPMLRNIDNRKLKNIYCEIRTMLMVIVLGTLILYQPLKVILELWLPQYSESLFYMGILFPIFVFESKTSMLTNTFLKTLRKEKEILIVNLVSIILSLILSVINIYLLDSFMLTVISILVLIGFKSIYSEIILSKYIDIKILKDIMLEVSLVIIFVSINFLLEPICAIITYLVFYIIYIFIKRKEIIKVLNETKFMIKNKY
ncbi:lipopolysaccharide biosynthesis protein [Clostridium sp. B9]|uniref:lipopolysaccharide biosynthesis protein n=1 Tax=Clostridium sp. B9 TaxID=3423224 RepID=UPI003D2EE346